MTKIFISDEKGLLIGECKTSNVELLNAILKMISKMKWQYDIEQG